MFQPPLIFRRERYVDRQKNAARPYALSGSRFTLLCLSVLCCLLLLLARVGYLQLLKRPMLEKQADARSLRTMPIQTNRGTLTDRNGEVLALSVPSRTNIVYPKVILVARPDCNDGKWRYLAEALNMPLADLQRTIVQDPSRRYVALRRKIESGNAQDIMKLNNPEFIRE